ncbi:MAG: aquaporin [Candidatus Sericytochromatia bacterium]
MSEAQQPSLARRLAAEAIGTAFLLMAIIGPGIMAARLAPQDGIWALAGIAAAVFTLLAGLIAMFQPISGAHFNPAVTLMVAALGDMKWRDVPAYIATQIAAGAVGVAVTNMMFDLPPVVFSTSARTGTGQWIGEFVATFGLFAAIWASARLRPTALPVVVAGYVFAAVWFTSSTCFANPAVTIGRALSDTAAGIRPVDVAPFILFQLLGAGAATALFQWLIPPAYAEYLERVVPHEAPPAEAAPDAPAPPRQRSASGPLQPHG